MHWCALLRSTFFAPYQYPLVLIRHAGNAGEPRTLSRRIASSWARRPLLLIGRCTVCHSRASSRRLVRLSQSSPRRASGGPLDTAARRSARIYQISVTIVVQVAAETNRDGTPALLFYRGLQSSRGAPLSLRQHAKASSTLTEVACIRNSVDFV